MNDCLCPRAPKGAARGHKNVHALNPIHESRSLHMMDHPSYAIILQIHTFNLPKMHEKPPFILPVSTFKSSRKIGDLLGIYHSKRVCVVCLHTSGRIATNIYDALGIFQHIIF